MDLVRCSVFPTLGSNKIFGVSPGVFYVACILHVVYLECNRSMYHQYLLIVSGSKSKVPVKIYHSSRPTPDLNTLLRHSCWTSSTTISTYKSNQVKPISSRIPASAVRGGGGCLLYTSSGGDSWGPKVPHLPNFLGKY